MLGCTSYSLDKEEKLTKAFLGRRPDGVILTGTHHTDDTRKLLANADVPVVEMWDLSDHQIDMAVGFDNFQAGYDIAKYMLGRGYRNIGYVAGTQIHEDHEIRAAKRSAGLYSAFNEACCPPPRRQNVADPLNIEDCGRVAADFAEANRDIDALICANEIIGVGAMKELQHRNWQIPDDISIAGIGDANIAGLIHPGLTTIRILGRRIGEQSAKAVLRRLRDPAPTDLQEDIGFEFVVRGSTK